MSQGLKALRPSITTNLEGGQSKHSFFTKKVEMCLPKKLKKTARMQRGGKSPEWPHNTERKWQQRGRLAQVPPYCSNIQGQVQD
jgi:hypothetical protein